MKKSTSIVLALTLILTLLASCSSTPSNNDSTPGATVSSGSNDSTPGVNTPSNSNQPVENSRKIAVTVGCRNLIPSLIPFVAPNPFTNAITGTFYQYLAQREKAGDSELSPGLAKSWKQIDSSTYEFELYDYITDSNGNKVTASDVAYSVEQAKAGGVVQANNVTSIEITGEYTFIARLSGDEVGNIEGFCENVFIVSQKSYEESPDQMATTPVGTGPYKLVDYVAGSYVIVEKRDDFWQKAEINSPYYYANVDVIRFDFLPESTQLEGALLQDNIQMAVQVNIVNISALEADSRYKVEAAPTATRRALVYNMMDGNPLCDIKIREAIAYAIDGQGLVDGVCDGYATVPKGIGGSTFIGYNPKWENPDYYAYNPAKAKQLLAEAGYPNGGLTLRVVNNGLTATVGYYEMMNAYLQEVGITLDVVNYEPSVYGGYQLNVVSNEWDLILGYNLNAIYQAAYWSGWLKAENFSHGLTQGGLEDPKLQGMLRKALNSDWIQKDVDDLNEYIIDNCLVYMFLIENNYHCANKAITNVYYGGRGDFRVGACTYSSDYSYFAD